MTGNTPAGALRVLVADDQPEIRDAFRLLLDSAPDTHVVAEAGDGLDAVRLTNALLPDVALMDIRMPGIDGIEATRRICASTPTKVVVLTTFDLDEYVVGALAAGASGFLLKNAAPADILAAARVVSSGDALLSPQVTRRLIDRVVRARPAPATSLLDPLTGREREVLHLIARGHSNAEICRRLSVSQATVKTHVNRLLSKLSCRDRAQLVIAAYNAGLVSPEPDTGTGRGPAPGNPPTG